MVLRDRTEWRELVEVGASLLFDPAHLLEENGAQALANTLSEERDMVPVERSGLFGGGVAAGRVVDGLMRFMV